MASLSLTTGRIGLLGVVWASLIACGGAPTPYPSATPLLSTSPPRPTAAPSATPAIPFEPIQLAWFYKPPDDGQLDPLQKFGFFILSHRDETVRDTLRSLHPGQTFLEYFALNEIYVPATCLQEPYGNQVAYIAGDYCRLMEQHPDWFLRDVQGKPVVFDGESAMMDASSPGWRAFWLQRVQTAVTSWGWRGIFLDNVEGSLQKLADHNFQLAAYSTDAQYQAQIEGFLKELAEGYFRPNHLPLMGNIIALQDPAVWIRYLRYLDGAMLEQFAVDWTDGYLTPAAWEEQLQLVEYAHAAGKTVILVAQGARANATREQYALASYLLVTYPQAYFRYANDQYYGEAWLYPNYAAPLGQPVGARYAVGAGWRRDFQHGTVTVSPATHTAEILIR